MYLDDRGKVCSYYAQMRVKYLNIKETGKYSLCAPLKKKKTVLDKRGVLMNMY